ncbi:MAG: ABC transporter substrate-binding protein [Phycisphaerales bacterium]
MRTSIAILAAGLLGATALAAETGVNDKTISVGQVAALRGPAKELGRGMQSGLQAYFGQVNRDGGINGRRISLRSVNDGYEPAKSADAAKMLIDQAGVFALIGGVGTPTARAIVPICEARQTPFIGPFTGAGFLRDANMSQVVNIRSSYDQEMESIAEVLTARGIDRIACFYQDDAYGQAGLSGITAALERRGLELCSTGTYERNTVAITGGFNSIKAGNPEAVVMVGAYTACSTFIRSAKADASMEDVTFCNISFVGTDALAATLGDMADGVIVSQVVPYPWDQSFPIVREYTKAMQTAGKEDEIGFVSFEGYITAKAFCTAIERINGEPTRAKLLAAFRQAPMDFGGMSLSFGSNDNQGSDAVFMTVFDGDRPSPLAGATFANVPTDR